MKEREKKIMNKDVCKVIKHAIVDMNMNISTFADANKINKSSLISALNNKRAFSYRNMIKIINVIPSLTFDDFEKHNQQIKEGK
jgi:predicted transcriptional regulator